MAALEIRKYGDPILRLKTTPIENFDDGLADFIQDMIETMQAAQGIGLAAPQVGDGKSLCVVDIGLIDEGKEPQAFINPEIVEAFGDSVTMEEGCLSIPGLSEEVARSEGIRVRYQSLDGETHEISVKDLLARVLQHEIDHLNGILFIDRLGPVKRKLINKKLRQISKGGD